MKFFKYIADDDTSICVGKGGESNSWTRKNGWDEICFCNLIGPRMMKTDTCQLIYMFITGGSMFSVNPPLGLRSPLKFLFWFDIKFKKVKWIF